MGRYAGEEYGDGSVSENSWRALKTQYRVMEDRALKAEAENTVLSARLEAVKALADEWEEGRSDYFADNLRAALDAGTAALAGDAGPDSGKDEG